MAIAHVPMIVRVGAAMEINPLVFGNAQRFGFGDGRQHDGRGLVDERIGVHELGVGEANVGIVGADGRDLIGAVAGAAVGERSSRGVRGAVC